MAVRVLLFDLGGVLVDYSGLEDLQPLLPEPMAQADLLARWSACPHSRAYGVGALTTEEFVVRFRRDWALSIDPAAFLEAWDSWVRGWLPGADALLEHLRPRYRLAALSNSNAAHWDRLARLSVLDAFDLALGSHQVGLRKPDPAIYHEALRRLDVPADAVLFFDDSAANVAAARRVGMRAAQVDGPDAIRRHLSPARPRL
jgi:putative hydrolase of the HAD superfamily